MENITNTEPTINDICSYIDRNKKKCPRRCRNIVNGQYYCAEHKRTVLRREERSKKSIDVMTQRQEKQPLTFDNERRINHSIWAFYPNTNKTPETLGESGMDKFDKMCELFSKPTIFLQFMVDKDGNTPPREDCLINIRTHYMTEVGEKMGRYHGQITIDITHDNCLRFDIPKINQQMNEYMNFRDDAGNLQKINLKYTQPKFPNIASDVWVNYATKNTRR